MFEQFKKKMQDKGVSDLAIKIFEFNFDKFTNKSNSVYLSSEIDPLNETSLVLDRFLIDSDSASDTNHERTKKIVVVKLNGGLGTSMGLTGPKSQLVVKDDFNFIDITVNQIRKFNLENKTNVPLIFMNSFNTNEETEINLNKLEFENENLPHSFNENKSPKISIRQNNTFEPSSFPSNPDLEWAPPGHADVYPALYQSGLLDELLQKGFEYLFISNIDNLGATLNKDIINSVFDLDSSFVMEVASRTENDKKGGHLAIKNGKLILRESSQVSQEDEADFQDFHKYKFFNTNSIWIKISKLKELLEKNNGILDLPIIINRKNIDPTDSSSEKIIQLESAMGSAISLFEDAKTILVPSERFLPVKNTSNLLFLMSDLVEIDKNFILHPLKNIYIDLKNENYKMINSFLERFKVIPSLKNCESLIIENDVFFNEKRDLVGTVKL